MKLAIFSILNFVVINCFSQSIKGQVLDTDTKKPLSYSSVYLVEPDNTDDTINIYYFTYLKYKIISRTKTDSIGNFSFDGLAPKMYNLVADYTMPEIKNLGLRGSRQEIDSNINITNGSNYFKVLHLMVTCPYDKTKSQTFCPKCKEKTK